MIIFFLIKNCNFPVPGPPDSTSKLQKKPSALKRSHPTLKNMNFSKKVTFVGHFCPPGSGSTDPIESGSDPNPQLCLQDLHRELLRGGARPEPWYSREPRRLPLHTDKYYCKRGTVARSRRSVILSWEAVLCNFLTSGTGTVTC